MTYVLFIHHSSGHFQITHWTSMLYLNYLNYKLYLNPNKKDKVYKSINNNKSVIRINVHINRLLRQENIFLNFTSFTFSINKRYLYLQLKLES